jgi:hypothetical protein
MSHTEIAAKIFESTELVQIKRRYWENYVGC